MVERINEFADAPDAVFVGLRSEFASEEEFRKRCKSPAICVKEALVGSSLP